MGKRLAPGAYSIFSRVLEQGLRNGLITQRYFEGDPLIWKSPHLSKASVTRAVEQLIAPLDMDNTVPMDARAKVRYCATGRRSNRCLKTGWRDLMQELTQLKDKARQTAGPYVHMAALPNFAISPVFTLRIWARRWSMPIPKGATDHPPGHGPLTAPAPRSRIAMIEIWQARARDFTPAKIHAARRTRTSPGWGRKGGGL